MVVPRLRAWASASRPRLPLSIAQILIGPSASSLMSVSPAGPVPTTQMSASMRASRSTVCASISMMMQFYKFEIAKYGSVLDRALPEFVAFDIGHADLKCRLDMIENDALRIGQVETENIAARIKVKLLDRELYFADPAVQSNDMA